MSMYLIVANDSASEHRKTLIRLGGCTGWSGPSLYAYASKAIFLIVRGLTYSFTPAPTIPIPTTHAPFVQWSSLRKKNLLIWSRYFPYRVDPFQKVLSEKANKQKRQTLRKHAYSNILKILPQKKKKWKFSDKKKIWYSSYFCSKYRLWVLVLMRTHNLRFE